MNRIVAELRASFLQRCQTSPDYDWWMNMGMKNGKLAVFDVGDNTIKYDNFHVMDVSDI